jgi:pimeloyl-ACP methyl ester carboxylesterase
MNPRWPHKTSDMRGAARLAVDATAGLASLVEAVHARILQTPGLPQVPGLTTTSSDGRTAGVAGLVYKTIRGVTHLVGGSIDSLLAALATELPAVGQDDAPHAEREALIAVLNGVLGDHLAATGNPLAIPMTLHHRGRSATRGATQAPDGAEDVAVFIHGLCMNDQQWTTPSGHDHGAALNRELGFIPVYLHYNTGLHIAANGKALAELLESTVDEWPRRIKRLVLIGHSMGGLVARSAMHHAELAGHRWLALLDAAVFLGTPHHGAPLERAGHWVDTMLGATPVLAHYTAPFARLGKLRSAGITDLRHGHLLDDGAPLPVPDRVACYAVAASLGQEQGDIKDRLLGDGLVPLASALGQHSQAARRLDFAPERQYIAWGSGHLDLLGDAAVFAQLVRWLSSRAPT